MAAPLRACGQNENSEEVAAMRKPVGILCLLTFMAAGLFSQQSDISRLAGPYLVYHRRV
jgi:hypothetical protein